MIGDRIFKRHLKSELPELVRKGVIDAPTALKIASHYEVDKPEGQGWLLASFATLGALCLLGGVILLFAHNWDELGRFTKVGLAFTPLAITHAVAAFALLTGRRSAPWREWTGVAMNLSLAAALGLVSQVYNLGGTFPEFVRYWSLLALPIPYVTGSVGAAVIWCGTWLISFGNPVNNGDVWMFWPGLAALTPFLWLTHREEPDGPRTHLASLAATATVVLGAILSHKFFIDSTPYTVFLTFTGAALYLSGAGRDGEFSVWKNPAKGVGTLGIAIWIITFSFPDVWTGLVRDNNWYGGTKPGWFQEYRYALIALSGAAWCYFATARVRARDFSTLALGVSAALFIALRYLVAPGSGVIAAMLVNLYGVALGVFTIREANAERAVGKLNGGMAIIAALAVARFVDSDLPMVVRGIGFIAVGAAFLTANWYVIRKRRAS